MKENSRGELPKEAKKAWNSEFKELAHWARKHKLEAVSIGAPLLLIFTAIGYIGWETWRLQELYEGTQTPSGATGTPRPTPTPTLEPTPTLKPYYTAAPEATRMPTPKPTPEATRTPISTPTPEATKTPVPPTATPRPTETPKPTATATPRPTATPEATPTPAQLTDAEITKLKFDYLQSLTLERSIIQTPEEAARRFGADLYSEDPSHWRITGNGAELIPNPNGTVTELKFDGKLITGSIIDNVINLVFLPDVNNIFVREGTVWNHPTDSMIVDQPKGRNFWVWLDPPAPSEFIPLAERLTQAKAAERFGGDAYSKNPNNWVINQYGGATLQPNPNGENSKLDNLTNGAIVEGWWRIFRDDIRFNAMTFVTKPDIGDVILTGGTVWPFPENQAEEGFKQLFSQLKPKEEIEQPGVRVLTLRNYDP